MTPIVVPVDPDRARSLLRRELLDPAYHQEPVLQRITDWIDRLLGSALEVSGRGGPLGTIAAVVVIAALVLGMALLVRRIRSGGHRVDAPGRSALPEVRISAAEHRARAVRALGAGDVGLAAEEAFRAHVMRLVEAGLLEDLPGATAGELAAAAAVARPELGAEFRAGAALFEEARYGERAPDVGAVGQMLELDDALAEGRR